MTMRSMQSLRVGGTMEYGICKDCKHWGEIPNGFDEHRHFLFCPVCKELMYLMHTGSPKEVGLNDSHKVNVQFVSQDRS